MIRNNINDYKLWKEKFEGVTRNRKQKTDRQYNGRKKKDKRTTIYKT